MFDLNFTARYNSEMQTPVRCTWATKPLDIEYHDREWGVPVHDDRLLFEFLILEGAQAGLSWSTILNKRVAYRKAFAEFDPRKVARFNDKKTAVLLENEGIVRNRLKIHAAVENGKAFEKVQSEFGTFDAYIWTFVGGKTKVNTWERMNQVPAQTSESERMSKDLLKRGFRFVGPTICYAFMQAVGLVNDHLVTCFRYGEIRG